MDYVWGDIMKCSYVRLCPCFLETHSKYLGVEVMMSVIYFKIFHKK